MYDDRTDERGKIFIKMTFSTFINKSIESNLGIQSTQETVSENCCPFLPYL